MKTILIILTFILTLSPYKLTHAQNIYFPPITGNNWDTISSLSLDWCPEKIDSLYNFLDINNTKAFILLKDGKIVLEKYFGSFTQNSTWYWASAGKTITSFMTGIAQQEGQLSINDTSSTYLGQHWTDCTPQQEEKITIWNQLTMTSGLDDGVSDNFCTLDTCLIYKADAGTRWAYHNGPYTLLDQVIENATGQTLNNYTTQKLKTPTGMTGLFIQQGYNNVFMSTARSMARFGLLILNNGNWNGNQIMTDHNYFNQMINSSQSLNPSYGYLWWLNGKSSYMVPGVQTILPGFLSPDAPSDMYAALGKNGQFIDVIPSQNIVWIRMGEAPDGSLVPYIFHNQIWDYLNNLNCNDLGTHQKIKSVISATPNPASDFIEIQSDVEISTVQIVDTQGKIVFTSSSIPITKIDIKNISSGTYFIEIKSIKNETSTLKFIKN